MALSTWRYIFWFSRNICLFEGENPVGGATQWSPEKAASEGYGFPAEVWAAGCVLLHMLTGSPPWLQRFPSAGALHFIVSVSTTWYRRLVGNVEIKSLWRHIYNFKWELSSCPKQWYPIHHVHPQFHTGIQEWPICPISSLWLRGHWEANQNCEDMGQICHPCIWNHSYILWTAYSLIKRRVWLPSEMNTMIF